MLIINFKTLWRLVGIFLALVSYQLFYDKFGIALSFMLVLGVLSLVFYPKALIIIGVFSTGVYFSRGFSFIPELLINGVLLLPITVLAYGFLQTEISRYKKNR
ncbi:hypothetical protein SUA94_07740 [Streptococcus agalactiae]